MKKLKILHVITHMDIGGAQDNTLYTCQYLDKSKYDVTIAANLQGGWVERLHLIDNLKIVHIPNLIRKVNIWNDILAFIKLYKHMRENKYDIIHTHSSKPGVIARWAAWCVRCPVIIHTIHGFPFHDYMNAFIRFVYIQIEQFLSLITDKIITVSKLNLAKVVALKIAPSDKCINIYSGISFEKYNLTGINKGKLRKELQLDEDIKIVAMIGRLSHQKSPDTFINSIPNIINKFPNTHFVLIGDGELKPYLMQLIKKNYKGKITFLGFRNDVPSLMADLDIYVLSSIYEGLGRSLTESMYCKIPVVATNVEGVPELVENNKTGILVEPKNSAALADGICFLLENPDRAKEMADIAFRRIVKNFSVEKMVNSISNLYGCYAKKL